ncbi:LPXTG cell wall anchor domain-containing protein [Streptococcus pseudoporcinus]|uniref:LPXTG cell wall anchor domain-containing protein n=1 Tax=Streptococcus pseudoporcinus TaxID=361101 RepID=UPI003A4C750C
MLATSGNPVQNSAVKKKLPTTGSKEQSSLLLSLVGVATLFVTTLSKKKNTDKKDLPQKARP